MSETTATVEAYTKFIEQYAHVALKKVKKPSEYDLDDFIQEGIKMLLLVKKTMYDPKRGSSFKTFFTLILRQHFGSMVAKSYLTPKSGDENASSIRIRRKPKICHNVFDTISTRYILQDFTPDELKYVHTIFLFIDKPVKFRRKFTRNALKISHERERELRNSIHDKILK